MCAASALRLAVRLLLFSLGAGLRDPVQLGLQAGDGVLALGAVSFGLLGVVADHVPHLGVVDVHLLTRRWSWTCW